MEHLLAHIHVFKTNIRKENIGEIKKVFNNKSVAQWSVDIEDCDRVLRVVSHELTQAEIISMVSRYGFECADLV